MANKVHLDELNLLPDVLKGEARRWAEKSAELHCNDSDAADEDTLNRILWFSVRGAARYPAEFTPGRDEDHD